MGRESDEVLEKEISDKVTSDWKAIYRLELHNSSYSLLKPDYVMFS